MKSFFHFHPKTCAEDSNQPNHPDKASPYDPCKWSYIYIYKTPYKWPYKLSNASYNYNLGVSTTHDNSEIK